MNCLYNIIYYIYKVRSIHKYLMSFVTGAIYYILHQHFIISVMVRVMSSLTGTPLITNLYILLYMGAIQKQLYRTLSDREFGWGGTSVRMEHGCPKSSSVRTETSLRLYGEKLL